jgi:DNA-binding HxlR family transcriptional regulator
MEVQCREEKYQKASCEAHHLCPVLTTLSVIGGKWKPAILWELQGHEVRRFGELRKSIIGITQKMLTQQLRELEADNIISRTVFPEIPPRVEYALTEYGATLCPILKEMVRWGEQHRKALEVQKVEE